MNYPQLARRPLRPTSTTPFATSTLDRWPGSDRRQAHRALAGGATRRVASRRTSKPGSFGAAEESRHHVPDACANIATNPRRPVARFLDREELQRLGAVLGAVFDYYRGEC